MEVIDCPVLSQHFPSVKLTSMCTLVALAVALQGGKICSLDLNEGVDLALKLGITSPIEGGISAAGCVRLAMEFGNPAFGALGENATAVEGQRLIKKHLKLGAPVVVMTTANLDPSGCGHAQCIVGMDQDNNLLIHDSYSSIVSRGPPSKEHSLGDPRWTSRAGQFLVSWQEFDRFFSLPLPLALYIFY
eukprot:TRINITY_DN5491_c0_g1_i4.p1 TRINITY_DN5491_c0_g1~~TRINITY_DN5491_c0_g1_i4.p1  ORF type:complete len:189 (-),score=42.55 TRINITY_DN5491_c0_g1_i4:474-1040(-)